MGRPMGCPTLMWANPGPTCARRPMHDWAGLKAVFTPAHECLLDWVILFAVGKRLCDLTPNLGMSGLPTPIADGPCFIFWILRITST